MGSAPESTRKPKSNAQWHEEYKVDPHADPYSIPLEELNPAHGDYFEAGTEVPLFDRLREEAPVHYCEQSQFGPYWSICLFDDIKHVDTDFKSFSSDRQFGGTRLFGRPIKGEPNPLTYLPMLIMTDPPTHDEQRKVLSPMFSPTNLASFGELIRGRAGEILDNLPRGETFDWVEHVSVELTAKMLATLFNVPQEDRHKLIYWSDTVERLNDPEYFASPTEGFEELWRCYDYFDAIRKERINDKEPQADLVSYLTHGSAAKAMSPNEFLGNILLLVVGGNDTTRNSISGGVIALNKFASEYDKLKANHGLIKNMVPEIIRWQSPVAHMCRTAVEDVEVGGKTIRKMDKVAIWYLSGNRQPDVFERPNDLVIDRRNARNSLAFGFGVHRCLGNRLAELQLRILWEEIMERFEHVEVVGEPTYLNSSFIRGITSLPVRVHDR